MSANDERFAFDAQVADAADDAVAAGEVEIPSIEALVSVAADAERRASEAQAREEGNGGEDPEEDEYSGQLDDELADLLGETSVGPEASSRHQKPPNVSLPVSPPDHDTDEYQESFASQREASELREEIESLNNKMSTMEQTLDIILKERQQLPEHLSSMKTSLNAQLTLMLEKLHTTAELKISEASAIAAGEVVQAAAAEVSDTLTAASSYLSSAPSSSSPLAKKGVSLTGKRRFMPKK